MDSLMRTPLECAAKWGRTEFARLMLDKGAKVDERNKYKGTCLHQAADGGHLALTKLLLERGAEIDPLTTYERTPLHFAAGKGHKNVCLAVSLSLSPSRIICRRNVHRLTLCLILRGCRWRKS
jgi:ankyrin repeat protein